MGMCQRQPRLPARRDVIGGRRSSSGSMTTPPNSALARMEIDGDRDHKGAGNFTKVAAGLLVRGERFTAFALARLVDWAGLGSLTRRWLRAILSAGTAYGPRAQIGWASWLG